MTRRMIVLVLVITFSGCGVSTIKEATPFRDRNASQICLIDNPDVARKEFREAYIKALEKKGFTVKVIKADSKISACKFTSTYTARWSWDLALYLTYANMKIYINGEKSGEATYKLVSGLFGKLFIDAEKTINELVDKLFPDRKTKQDQVGKQ